MSTAPDCASNLLDALVSLAKLEGIISSPQAVAAGLPLVKGQLSPDLFVRAANRIGLAALPVKREFERINEKSLPSVLLLGEGKACVLTGIDRDLQLAFIQHPHCDEIVQVKISELEELYTGQLFLTRRMQQFDDRSPKIFKDDGEHWFWGVIKNSKKIYRDVLIAAFFINLFVLAQPLFVMNVYDRVVPNSAFETLWALAIGVLIVYLFDLLLKTLRSFFVELAARRADIILSSQLFEKVLNLSQRSRPVSVGAFANRLHEFDSIRNFITSSTVLTLVDLPFVVLFIAVIGWLGGWLALVPVCVIPVALFIGLHSQRKVKPAIENVMRAGARKNATLVESLTGIETIKSLGAEGKVQRDWEQSVGFVAQWGLEARKISTTATNAVMFLQQISMVVIVVAGAYLIADLSLTVGGLIACVILNGRALAPLGQVAGILSQYQYAQSTLHSLDEIMGLPEDRKTGMRYMSRSTFHGEITFRNTSFRYAEIQPLALQGVNLHISPGEKVGIIGRVGSGKSTLARLCVKLYDATSGSVMLDDFDIQQLDPVDIRKNIGFLAQDVTLFYGSLRENILLGATAASDAQVVEAAEKAGMTGFVNAHPQGLEMLVGERGQNLSGGQRQATGLARLFLRNPPIWLLDEPTSAMDNGSEELVRRNIAAACEDKTLVVITHKHSMLKLVDRLVVVDKGTIVADGPKADVLDSLKSGTVRGRVG